MKSIEKHQISKWLKGFYGLDATVESQMDGYGSINYKIASKTRCYVLKIYEYSDTAHQVLKDENDLLFALSAHLEIEVSIPVYSFQLQDLVIVDEEQLILRLLSFVEGKFWAESEIGYGHIKSLGYNLAVIDKLLAQKYKAHIAAKKMDWDPLRMAILDSKLHYIKDLSLRNHIRYFLGQINLLWSKRLILLPQQLIYNDAHEWNLLVNKQELCGLIDLGDMIHSCRINELAVAAAYLVMNDQNDDPIKVVGHLVKAYHEENALLMEELEALYYLVVGRACMSLLNGAEMSSIHPDNEYLAVSSHGAKKLINQWLSLSPILFETRLKKHLGFEISQKADENLLIALKDRKQYIPNSFSLSYQHPLHIDRAAFQYIYDTGGNRILDAYNNIIHVGHCHPHVVDAGNRMMAKINTNTRYVYNVLGEYAEKLLNYFPASLNKVFFVNSGSAASDLALRLAINYTGRDKIISMEHGYHGNTQLGINISHYKYASKGGKGYSNQSISLAMPDEYNGPHSDSTYPGLEYAKDAIQHIEAHQDEFAAFIAEPIIGCGGQVPLAKNYLKELYPYLRKKEILCISDEVQVGFGRLGSSFWGFEMHEVLPDLVILGKPIGNGHPMAAVVCTTEIAEAFNNGMEFFSSFGGNPVSCAIGQAVLEVLEQENLQTKAMQIGNYLKSEFDELKKSFPTIGDVRGQGLFLGIELVLDPISKNPNTALASYLSNALRMQNVLVSTDGPYNQVIKIKPPLCFNQQNADELLEKSSSLLKNWLQL